MNLLQNIKWNGRCYPLETRVSNYHQEFEDIQECATHITNSVPDQVQRVECLIGRILYLDNTLQAAIGLVRASTKICATIFCQRQVR